MKETVKLQTAMTFVFVQMVEPLHSAVQRSTTKVGLVAFQDLRLPSEISVQTKRQLVRDSAALTVGVLSCLRVRQGNHGPNA